MSATDKETERIADIEERLRDPRSVRRAFEELIGIFSERLYWQIRRMVGSHEDADDVLQNTFMKAWSNIENFRAEARIGTWLHKIAINESLSHLEKQKRYAGEPIESAMAVEAASDFDGDQLAADLRRAVDSLPEKQRLVFNMKYFDDMKYDDISNILGTSVGALKASYHAAVKKIEQFFTNRH